MGVGGGGWGSKGGVLTDVPKACRQFAAGKDETAGSCTGTSFTTREALYGNERIKTNEELEKGRTLA